MAYRIVYGPPMVRGKKRSGRALRLQAMTAGFLLVFLLTVGRVWPEGTQKLREYLLPVEGTALQDLAAELGNGEPVGEALEAFCRQIIENARTDAR